MCLMCTACSMHSRGGREGARESDKKLADRVFYALAFRLHNFASFCNAVCVRKPQVYLHSFYADSSNKMSFYFNYAFKNLVSCLNFSFHKAVYFVCYVCYLCVFLWNLCTQRRIETLQASTILMCVQCSLFSNVWNFNEINYSLRKVRNWES